MSFNGTNYVEDGKIVIGGEVEFKPGTKMNGIVENVEADTGAATKNAAVLNDLLLKLKKSGIMVGDTWTVSIPTGITYANMATAGTAANSNKVTVTLEDGEIKVAVGGKIEDELEKVDHGETWGKHYWLGFGIRTGFESVAGVKFTQLTGMDPGVAGTVATLSAADDAEANSVGLASGGDIILYIKAEAVRKRGMRIKLEYPGMKDVELTVVIDETETD